MTAGESSLPWGALPGDTTDPNYGRTCGRCHAPIRAGMRYEHACPAPLFRDEEHAIDYLATGDPEHRAAAVSLLRGRAALVVEVRAFLADPFSASSASHGHALALLGRVR